MEACKCAAEKHSKSPGAATAGTAASSGAVSGTGADGYSGLRPGGADLRAALYSAKDQAAVVLASGRRKWAREKTNRAPPRNRPDRRPPIDLGLDSHPPSVAVGADVRSQPAGMRGNGRGNAQAGEVQENARRGNAGGGDCGGEKSGNRRVVLKLPPRGFGAQQETHPAKKTRCARGGCAGAKSPAGRRAGGARNFPRRAAKCENLAAENPPRQRGRRQRSGMKLGNFHLRVL